MRRGQIVADGTAAEVKALASGRTLRATLPGADRAALAALPGVDAVEVRGDSVLVTARDTDGVARHLLTRTGARDLEITSRNLEQAFLTLTADTIGTTTPPGAPDDHHHPASPQPAETRRLLRHADRPGTETPAAQPAHGRSSRSSCPRCFLLIFGSSAEYRTTSAGNGNVTGWIMVSMAVYGAMLATTSGGAMVSVERAAGWSRQLRLTPLRPVAYIGVKVVLAMTTGLISVLVAFAVGRAIGAQLPATAWIACGLLAWICALVFAAFGLFMGYLLPSENVMQILGPVLGILSFAGGLFVPVDQLRQHVRRRSRRSPRCTASARSPGTR